MKRGKVTLILLAAFGLVSVLAFGYATAKQSDDRVVTKFRRIPLPVNIKAIKTKRGGVRAGEKFKGEDDWFKRLTVSVENTSGKTIIYVGGGFLFPNAENQGTDPAPLYHRFMYGCHPLAPEGATTSAAAVSVRPGETLEITLPEGDFSSLRHKLDTLGYPASIKEIKINIEEVYFDDGTAWRAGSLYRRDPDNPQKYRRLEKKTAEEPTLSKQASWPSILKAGWGSI